jgi:DNA polymerase-3 subunit epsilon
MSPEAVLERYRQAFRSTWRDDSPIFGVRFVVLDSETTGLDTRRDRLVSIGAVAVREEAIVLEDSFEVLLKVAYNTASVVVHGITREASRAGLDEASALTELLDYLGDGVIVGHHIGMDIEMLDNALERCFGLRLENRHLDTLGLALHLQRDGVLGDDPPLQGYSLDALCRRFDVAPYDRHTAPGDAFLTAQVFLHLLRLAQRAGRDTLGALCEPYREAEGE